jgi:hypothetical protein
MGRFAARSRGRDARAGIRATARDRCSLAEAWLVAMTPAAIAMTNQPREGMPKAELRTARPAGSRRRCCRWRRRRARKLRADVAEQPDAPRQRITIVLDYPVEFGEERHCSSGDDCGSGAPGQRSAISRGCRERSARVLQSAVSAAASATQQICHLWKELIVKFDPKDTL